LPYEPERDTKDIPERNELLITKVDNVHVPDLSTWWRGVQQWYKPMPDEAAPQPEAAPGAQAGAPVPGGPAAPGAAPSVPGAAPAMPGTAAPAMPGAAPGAPGATTVAGPTGPGWVFQVWGYHYHNPRGNPDEEGPRFVEKTLIKNLHQSSLPSREGDDRVPVVEVGIQFPVLLDPKEIWVETLENPNVNTEAPGEAEGGGNGPPAKNQVQLRRFDFTVQFVWKEPTPEGQTPMPGGP